MTSNPAAPGPPADRVPVAHPRALAASAAVSGGLAVLLAGSALAGLVGGYPGPGSVSAVLRGYDLVTLLLTVPLLGWAAARRTPRAALVWAGVLMSLVYTYAYYLFGTELTVLFPAHAVVFTLSLAALVLLLAAIDVPRLAAGFGPRTPVRFAGGVLLLLGVALAVMWTAGTVRALAAGSALAEPSRLIVPAAVTRLGAALDLSLLAPAYGLAGVLLWRRAGWGYVAATGLLVAGVLHQVAYLTALVVQRVAEVPGAPGFDPVEPVIVAAFAVGAALMLAHGGRRPARAGGQRPSA
ncbi:hypothetical protein GCM10020358_40060 [Amorphoplanes nipponensis]|uniref:Uncharacterized protein n=1 Tax=Actinoplanes nipponensis TaxID=135950 RepID=A0A919JVE8_9ACTN|nr:hypothetical protein [Actinoplanes nipponensis]GIE53709.1 hypothetical protein Ani05nite_72430 [Actinoplanes nipponensis]